jgi:hypothetical protein
MKARFLWKMFSPDLKALLCQEHMQNFRSIARSSKKIDTPRVYFLNLMVLFMYTYYINNEIDSSE